MAGRVLADQLRAGHCLSIGLRIQQIPADFYGMARRVRDFVEAGPGGKNWLRVIRGEPLVEATVLVASMFARERPSGSGGWPLTHSSCSDFANPLLRRLALEFWAEGQNYSVAHDEHYCCSQP